MTTSLDTIPEEFPSTPGLVYAMLPWHWQAPGPVRTAAGFLAGAYQQLKGNLPLTRPGLEAAEEGVIYIGSRVVKVADDTARRLDRGLTPWIAEAKLKSKQLQKVESSVLSSWNRRDELCVVAMDRLAGTSVAQIGLRAADSLLACLENWTLTYQAKSIRFIRRWLRRIRRGGLHTKTETRPNASPRKRMKIMHRIWHWLSPAVLPLNMDNTVPDTLRIPHDEDRKRKLESESSDSDYSPEEDSDDTDSLEYRSDEGEVSDEEQEEETSVNKIPLPASPAEPVNHSNGQVAPQTEDADPVSPRTQDCQSS